ncbi:hypothetical protein M6B38_209140 [Iris pallida]|uniref:Uncharacterized protein n=1 Tax=Iris pallida TaxID=29817 RepID=A0AAX6E4U8_IRIPA|nr:hypothetical protein M6B38_209140 [Iris pallida]
MTIMNSTARIGELSNPSLFFLLYVGSILICSFDRSAESSSPTFLGGEFDHWSGNPSR